MTTEQNMKNTSHVMYTSITSPLCSLRERLLNN